MGVELTELLLQPHELTDDITWRDANRAILAVSAARVAAAIASAARTMTADAFRWLGDVSAATTGACCCGDVAALAVPTTVAAAPAALTVFAVGNAPSVVTDG